MIYCLTAAALWAISLSLFTGAIGDLGPRAANFFKCTFAALLYWTWIAIAGPGGSLGTPTEWTALAISGILGFTLGDLFLFISVREGGVQRALVLFNTSPIMTALVGIPMLGQVPTAGAWIGMALILAGVALVETDPRRVAHAAAQPARPRPWLATVAGLGAAAGQAGGILFSSDALKVVPVLPASAMRLTAGAVALLPMLLFARSGRGLSQVGPRHWGRLAGPTTIGTVVALLFAMRGIQVLPAGIAAALLATTPIFALPISFFVLKEPLGPRSLFGTVLAVTGVVLLNP